MGCDLDNEVLDGAPANFFLEGWSGNIDDDEVVVEVIGGCLDEEEKVSPSDVSLRLVADVETRVELSTSLPTSIRFSLNSSLQPTDAPSLPLSSSSSASASEAEATLVTAEKA